MAPPNPTQDSAKLVQHKDIFQRIQDSATDGYSNIFPIVGKTRELRAHRVWVDDDKDPHDYKSQEDTKLNGGTWGIPVYGDLELVEKGTGRTIDRRERVKLATLPKLTPRYSFIVKGNEYQVTHQMRRKPGVYSRIGADGNIEAMFNSRIGSNFKMLLDKDTGEMHLNVGSSNTRLYPVLKHLGVSDQEMAEHFGPEIVGINQKAVGHPDNEVRDVIKLYKNLHFKQEPQSFQHAVDSLKNYFTGNTAFEPDVLDINFGEAHTNANPKLLLQVGKKLLDISRGTNEPDDQESVIYKTLHGVDDFLKERIGLRSERQKLHKKVLNNLDRKDSISDIIHHQIFTHPVESLFTQTELANLEDQTNPLSMLGRAHQVTIHGPGGLENEHQVSLEARGVHPTHFGFLDTIQTPESHQVGAVLRLPMGTVKDGNTWKTEVINHSNGQREHLTAKEFYDRTVAFPDDFHELKDGSLRPVASHGLVRAMRRGRFLEVRPDEVEYRVPTPRSAFGLLTNMAPFLQCNSGKRGLMISKMAEQALPLVNREIPLVQVLAGPGGHSYEEMVGQGFTTRAPINGSVTHVGDGEIHIQSGGKTHRVQYYQNFPLNAKHFFHSEPTVKPGDVVHQGQLLAELNHTRNGTLSTGVNARVGYFPYRGYNFEDGHVVRAGFAREHLKSMHLHKESFLAGDETMLDLAKFRAHHPLHMSEAQSKKLDARGVVKIGESVEPGDTLIAGMSPNMPKVEDQVLKNLHRSLVKPWSNSAVTWDHDHPGKVVKIGRHGNRIDVYIQTEEGAVEGDKIVGRYANKGIITRCHDPLTEVLTRRGWVFFKDLISEDEVCTLNPSTRQIEYHIPTKRIDVEYTGKMYRFLGRRLDLFTTPEHSHFVRDARNKNYRLEEAKDCFGKQRVHLRTGSWVGREEQVIVIPGRPRRGNNHLKFCGAEAYPADEFLEFFGYWITEGCIGKERTSVHLGQRQEVNPEVYENMGHVLERLGYDVHSGPDGHTVYDPRLNHWLRQFGLSQEKFIPREFLELPQRQLRILADAIFAGDGGVYFREKDNHTRFELYTSSKRLADDYQELALKLGFSANIKPQVREDRGTTEYVVRWSLKEEVYAYANDTKRGRKQPAEESWVDYSGRVYCVEVQNHVVYIRRNGIPVWSGNCVPDHEMPHTADGKPLDVIFNQHGLPSRLNNGQILETLASKIAEKTGKVYRTENFKPGVDYWSQINNELKAHGISDTEEVFDPRDGGSIGKVLVGKQYIMKLDHSVSKKFNARDRAGYSMDKTPVRGSDDGAQSVDPLMLYGLISHNARELLYEMATMKSERNDDLWRSIQTGSPLPPPKTTFVWDKFMGLLQGMGLDVKKEGSRIKILPSTDAQTLSRSKGEIQVPFTLRAKDLAPMEGGLLDPEKTGGIGGGHWTHLSLHEAFPNPVFEGPIKSLLGLTGPQFEDLMAGKVGVLNGQLVSGTEPGAKVAGEGVHELLSRIDPQAELARTTDQARGARSNDLDRLNKKIRYLKALAENNLRPEAAYMMRHVPIVPPKFRPIYPMGDGSLYTADLNYIYKNLLIGSEQLGAGRDILPQKHLAPLRQEIYHHLKGMAGLEPLSSAQDGREYHGILTDIRGKNAPKEGLFQQKLIRRRQDLSARSTIVTGPELGAHEVGLPKEMLKSIFRPFVIRRLFGMGISPLKAQEMLEREDPAAMKALEQECKERPVILNRAPALHKFSELAFYPKMVDGLSIKLHPLVIAGFGADFDGDTMSVHPPVTDKGVEEAKRLLATHPDNLRNPGTGKLMILPQREHLLGLYRLTLQGGKQDLRATPFENLGEAREALKKKQIHYNDTITIKDHQGIPQKTTVGRALVNSLLPEQHRDPNRILDSKGLGEVAKRIAESHPHDFGRIMNDLKDLGGEHAFKSGTTITFKDLEPLREERDKILEAARRKARLVKFDDRLTPEQKEEETIKAYTEAATLMDKMLQDKVPMSNNLAEMVRAGAVGNWAQLRQVLAAPVLLEGVGGKPVPVLVSHSYSEGLPLAEYFIQSFGSRKGAVDKSKQTSVPGYFAKQLVNSMINLVAQDDEHDGPVPGIKLGVDDPDVHDRYLAQELPGVARAGDLVTPDLLRRARNAGHQELEVRSPLTSLAAHGVYAKDYGLLPGGRPVKAGENIGVMAAQAMSEPATQMSMKVGHTGGVVGGATMSGFQRILQLFELPENLPGKGTLSEAPGMVENIQKAPTGGYFVSISGVPHRLLPGVEPTVKPGDTVEQGQVISTGVIQPKELLRLKGLRATQDYLVNEIMKNYHDQGIKLKRVIVESAVRAMTNLTRVHDPGEDPDYAPGDYTSVSMVEHKNRSGANISHEPVLKGIKSLPLYGEDWLSQLNFENLKDTILDAAAKGRTEDIHGYNPLVSYAYGAEFSRPPKHAPKGVY